LAAGRSPLSAIPTAISNAAMDQTMSDGVRFGLIVHHTDAEREYAYDRNTPFGHLDKCNGRRQL